MNREIERERKPNLTLWAEVSARIDVWRQIQRRIVMEKATTKAGESIFDRCDM